MASARLIDHLARSPVGSISICVSRDRSRSIKTERCLASTSVGRSGGGEHGYSLPKHVIMLRSNLHGKLRQRRKNDFLLAWASDGNFSIETSVSFFHA
jgi:hypothetical protein